MHSILFRRSVNISSTFCNRTCSVISRTNFTVSQQFSKQGLPGYLLPNLSGQIAKNLHRTIKNSGFENRIQVVNEVCKGNCSFVMPGGIRCYCNSPKSTQPKESIGPGPTLKDFKGTNSLQ
jgi:hypothetical protein